VDNLEKFLEIEKTNDILSYKFSFDDFLIWPIVRFTVLSNILKNYNNDKTNSRLKKIKLLKYFFNVFFHYPYFVKNKKIAIFGSCVTNVLINGDSYFNRIHDYYNFIYPEDTIFFERPFNFMYKRPRAFKNTYYHDYIKIMPVLKSKFSKNIDDKTMNSINSFIIFLKENFAMKFDNSFYEKIKKQLINESKRIKYRKKYFSQLIDKINPKIIFLEDAHYGGESYMIKWAKERGIIIAEFQHGVVSKTHPAYNYGEAILNSEEYKKYTPDYFLTYGEYWNNQINIPGKAYVVGNPHFHESIKRYKDIEEEKGIILIVSQWTLTEEFVEIAKFLANNLKDKKIVFKMHPGEMRNYNLIKPLEAYRNIEIQKDGDIYELLAKYESIVGCYSTTVFEALAFKKRIYLLDNSYSKNNIPEEIGIRFKNFPELKNLIKNKVKNENEPDIEYYFNSNWQENYKKFIEQEIGITINNKNEKIFFKISQQKQKDSKYFEQTED